MLADMLRESQAAPAQSTSTFIPAADVLETATGFELHLALPGVKKAAVSIKFLDGELVVAGERSNQGSRPSFRRNHIGRRFGCSQVPPY